jgi:L-glyceraldehyde 3-phosphate reductase
MYERWVEGGLLDLLGNEGIGCIPFSPLAQGLLTDKYLKGIPADSRAAKAHGALQENQITAEKVSQLNKLNDLAKSRGQKLAQMALSWLLRDNRITSVLVGASRPEQLADSLACLTNTTFSPDELTQIDVILANAENN